MKSSCLHTDDVGWQSSSGMIYRGMRWKEILNRDQGGSEEFTFGLAELAPGTKQPLHKTRQALTGYILSGYANIQLGVRKIELDSISAFYLPANAPHSIEALGPSPLQYIYTYACEKPSHNIEWEIVSEEEAAQLEIVNFPPNTWALSEDYEKWLNVEPSKGRRMRIKFLFGEKYFSAEQNTSQTEMHVGVAEMDPGTHYTLHYHTQPEIYYFLGGRGIVYVEDKEFEVRTGSTIYLGKKVVHGIDVQGDGPLRFYYIYGCETEGQALTWTPVEDIYTNIRRPLQ